MFIALFVIKFLPIPAHIATDTKVVEEQPVIGFVTVMV